MMVLLFGDVVGMLVNVYCWNLSSVFEFGIGLY